MVKSSEIKIVLGNLTMIKVDAFVNLANKTI